MRRVISFILVLVLVFSMGCVAFADTPSKEGGGIIDGDDSNDGNSGCNHKYVNGVCKYCGKGVNPKNGDTILFWVAVLLTSLAAMGGMAVVYRKKFRN